MKATKTWVLIADGARAHILENDGPGRGLQAVEGMSFEAPHDATHNLVADREGRAHDSTTPSRSAIEAHSDPHRELKRKFAQQLAAVLASALDKASYDRLILVAAPVTLGDLRGAISDHVKAKVIGEMARDLTKVPNNEIASHLTDILNC